VIVMLLGGARSGKSDLAVRIAAGQTEPVVLIATAQAGDADMTQRIERHRSERPDDWGTIEAPIALEEAIDRVPEEHCLILDDLTLWAANLLAAHDDEEIEARAARAAAAAARRRGLTLVVSNEVGLGIVPDNALARRYQDLLGRVNAAWAAAADRTYFLVAGRSLRLHPADEMIQELTQ
jgi:adenosylcobinamide kinase / adenosylcobinamide-phosphate guanylyltransferase